LDLDKINKVREVTIGDFQPDITFVLDLDIKDGINRKNIQAERNRFEDMKLEFHERVREGFLKIVKENEKRCVLIDSGKLSIEEIHEEIFKRIKNDLKRS
jgi:dTMP kinase